ncbi:conserved hypothetical protein [Ricinus communis]|uniref:Uncharacterized protein n=1 Tax=Ricinus communis TaxID=3988 RepID=B9RK29_RICCO|nr:conserved hypothetical protein [Ricinus communis]
MEEHYIWIAIKGHTSQTLAASNKPVKIALNCNGRSGHLCCQLSVTTDRPVSKL